MVSMDEFPVAAKSQFRHRRRKKEADIVGIVTRDRTAVEFLYQVTHQGHCVIDSAGIGVRVQNAVNVPDKAGFLPEFPQGRLLRCFPKLHISPRKTPEASLGLNTAPHQKETTFAVDRYDAGGGDGVLIERSLASRTKETPTSLPFFSD